MAKKMTVHYVDGCAWANGQLYSSDTDQTRDWKKVTCKHCLNRLYPRGMGARPDWETVKRKVIPRRSYGKGNK
jgi:hypothetical protein